MALFGFIDRDGVLGDVGQLPPSANRLDTGKVVHDLAGTGRRWARACGWYDLTDPADVALIPADIRATLAETIAAEVNRQNARREFVTDARNTAAIAKERNWDWLDLYSGIPIPGSPNAGIEWPNLDAGQKAEQLRIGVSLALYENIRYADVLLLLIRVLVNLIELEGGDVGDLDPIGEP